MTMLSYVQIIAPLLCFIFIFHRRRCCRNPIVTDWPILGMLPQLLCNLWHFHDYVSQALKTQAGTGIFKGPWFTGMNYVVTCDPMNVHHITSKNFSNYEKGPEFRETFDEVLGDGILSADSETWKYNRRLLHSLLRNKNFEVFVEKVVQNKVENCLFPVLDHVQREGIEVDLQDVFKRFIFDNMCSIVLGYDPECIAVDFPEVACAKAFCEAEELVFYRHTVPRSFWKLQKWLQIGAEKKMATAWKTFDQFLYESIASKRKNLRSKFCNKDETEELGQSDLLTTLLKEEEGKRGVDLDDKFLRDTAVNLLSAGKETLTSALTWFFWLVATHPSKEAKILEEIKDKIVGKGGNPTNLGVDEVNNLVYLHGAICEALRLFPPLPIDRKQAIQSDILPSGHSIDPKTTIFLFFYAMGRLEDIWGKDCLKFKPERWISETGCIVHVPSYKFVFGAGPRNCLGKNLSFNLMKIVATAILWNYHIQVVEHHPVSPAVTIVLMMKHGLKVSITKRA